MRTTTVRASLVSLWTIGAIAASVGQATLGTSKTKTPFDKSFEELVNETLEYWKVPGLAIAVIDGDDVWAEGYGYAILPSTPVTPNTLFYTGSTTKAFTAAMMSLLVDDDEQYPGVQWTTPVSELIRDDFVLQDEWSTTHLTIEDTLTHRTGMPRHDNSYAKAYDARPATARDVVRSLRHLPLSAPPRTTYQYCNLMFVVATHVIETLTGSWLGDQLRARIWEPLNMTSTFFATEDALRSGGLLSKGYWFDNTTAQYSSIDSQNLDGIAGAGSIISNVVDYSKWVASLLAKTAPLSPAGHQAIRTPRSLVPTDPQTSEYTGAVAYALGWNSAVYHGVHVIRHQGTTEAWGADVAFLPALGFGVVAFGNAAVTGNAAAEKLVFEMINRKLGVPESERYDSNKKYRKMIDGLAAHFDNALQEIYPNLPEPALPAVLPLSAYVGTYFHPGYLNMTLELPSASEQTDYVLVADRTDQTWAMLYRFAHVSGENWLAYSDSARVRDGTYRVAAAAEFRLSPAGEVTELGINMEPQLGPDARIWFKRIAA